jgi:hypothetical protein
MKKLILLLFIPLVFCCSDNTNIEVEDGGNLLLIGNSFFRPYAENLDVVALDAGYQNHNSTLVIRGGENGRPINFWNDSTSQEHQEIKYALDQGGLDFFGMTSGHNSENRIEGHKNWIEYAIQNNPNITIFISISPFDFPAGDPNSTRPNWNLLSIENGFNSIQELYDYYVNEIIHKEIVDELRIIFPTTNIFTIPTGWATKNLAQMQLDDLLLDEIELFGPKPISIFTDPKGHQGQIVIEAGTLIWLNSIYNEELSGNNYETGFNTDLHSIAEDIMNSHNSDYKK